MAAPAIGFDFGTTNSAIAVVGPGSDTARLLHLDRTQRDATFIPTALYLTRDGATHIGYDAIDAFVRAESGRTILRKRQAMGLEIETVLGVHKVWSEVDVNQPGRFFQTLKTFLADHSFRGTNVFGRFYTPEELIATIMRAMRLRAEEELGQPVTTATVGRPVHWAEQNPAGDALALTRMESALRLAGFGAFDFVLEPIAAGLHFASTLPAARTVFVFDFGGGTLDLTVMRIGGGQRAVISTAGIPLGGNTLDEEIMDGRLLRYFGENLRWGAQDLPMPQHILDTIRRWDTIPELNEAATIAFLRNLERETAGAARQQVQALLSLARGNRGWALFGAIERAKIGLSTRERERIRFAEEAIAIDEALPRRDFEGLIAGRVQQAARCIDDALAAASRTPGQIDAVVYTGGSSTIPAFQRLLADTFGADKLRFQDAFASVVTGLALSAADQGAKSDLW
ncbi:MAG: Hsp70 family protein [Thermomicrobia bacterium]|nr:Hsp70 family protein [Thermomicrobia bacterium]MCA1724653.1 Hsp70 family protein [Thermomicrobia bacterium]